MAERSAGEGSQPAARAHAPRRAQVLDLFPQTAHLEIVALLER